MTLLRHIARVVTPPPVGPGFAGPRHTATLVIPPGDFAATNPFFLLADDRTEIGGQFGEAHPHAGLETVTFMLSGSFEDQEGRLDVGDVEWMTSGRGVVHGQDTVTSDRMRLLQLWIVLPKISDAPLRACNACRSGRCLCVRAPGPRPECTAAGLATSSPKR